ncbi:MAG: DUF1573 domain-containing protein [Chitinivibrionales bacterium]
MHKKIGTICLKLPALVLLMMVSLLFSAPVIEVDSANYDFGAIQEGSVKVVKYEFKIRNTGDEPLKIEKLRPG